MVSSAIYKSLPDAKTRSVDDADDEFFIVRDVPVFAEHQTQAKNGRQLSFGYNELKAVCDRCNQRIADTGDYAAITIGHTPDPALIATGRAQSPRIVGFAGPFKMGLLGDNAQNRRYAILADFRIFKDDWELVRRHPRRSPELWLEESYDRMFLDPIALLGAEAPRLDMGLLYSAVRHASQGDTLVEKYAAVAPAAGTVFVPSDRYAAQQGQENSTMLTQDDIGQLVQAIQQTDVWQWVTNKMQEDGGNNSSANQGSEPDMSSIPPSQPIPDNAMQGGMPGSPPQGMAGGPPPAPPAAPAPGAPQAAGGSPPPADRQKQSNNMAHGGMSRSAYAAGADDAMPDDDDDEDNRPMIGEDEEDEDEEGKEGDTDVDNDEEAKQKYSRAGNRLPNTAQLVQLVQKLSKQLKRAEAQLNEERAHRIDAQRYSKLQQMVAEGVLIDCDKEMKRLNYSKASDEQFASAIEFINEHAQRMPTNLLIPTFDDAPRSSGGAEKYSKENADRALRICEQKALKGESVDYVSVLSDVAAGRL